MARIHALPSLEIIRGLKGILDFYMWKGLPCVRAWPKYRPAKQTAASLAAALVFGAIVKSYSLLGDLPLEAYRHDALDQTRTARDIMVTGVYGNLHEASMSDFLDLLQQSRDFLSDLTALLNALDSIDTDELVVNVDQTVLPPTAATDTHQLTQITALQKLDDLQDALQSKALDRLLVRGEDQLFTITDILHSSRTDALNMNDGRCRSDRAAGNFYSVITTVSVVNPARATTAWILKTTGPAGEVAFYSDYHAIAAGEIVTWSGLVLLTYPNYVHSYNIGGLLNDQCTTQLSGYKMTLET